MNYSKFLPIISIAILMSRPVPLWGMPEPESWVESATPLPSPGAAARPSSAPPDSVSCVLPGSNISIMDDVISSPKVYCRGCEVNSITGRKANQSSFPSISRKESRTSNGRFPISTDEYTTTFYPFIDVVSYNDLPSGKNTLSFDIRCESGAQHNFKFEVEVRRTAEPVPTGQQLPLKQTQRDSADKMITAMESVNQQSQNSAEECALPYSWVIPKVAGQDENAVPPPGVTHPFATLNQKKLFAESGQVNNFLWNAIHSPLGLGGGSVKFTPGTIDFPSQFYGSDLILGSVVNQYGFVKVKYHDSSGMAHSAIAFMVTTPNLNKLSTLTANYAGTPIVVVDFFMDEHYHPFMQGVGTTLVGAYIEAHKYIITLRNRCDTSSYQGLPYSGQPPEIWIDPSSDGCVAYPDSLEAPLIAHEIGHSLGLGHDAIENHLMFGEGSFLEPKMTRYQGCKARSLCYNPSLLPQDFASGYLCGDGWLHEGGDLHSTFEECEKGFFEGVSAPFRANCDKINPTPGGSGFAFGEEGADGVKSVWGALDTPYYCYNEVPSNSKYYLSDPRNKCRVIEFCGDGIIDFLKQGEECDPASSSANHGCPENKDCGGIVKLGDNTKLSRNCICVDQCEEDQIWCSSAKKCCAEDSACTPDGCDDKDTCSADGGYWCQAAKKCCDKGFTCTPEGCIGEDKDPSLGKPPRGRSRIL